MIARVAIDIGIGRLFDYSIPDRWCRQARPGARVTVPFGQRKASGYIVELIAAPVLDEGACGALPGAKDGETFLFDLPADSPQRVRDAGLKEIIEVDAAEKPHILPSLLKLAEWMAGYYLAPFERCLQTLLPAPVRSGRSRSLERLFVEAIEAGVSTQSRGDTEAQRQAGGEELTARQRELLEDIRRVGGGWLRQVCDEFKCAPTTLRKLEEQGVITIQPRVIRRDPLANRRILPTKPLKLNDEQAEALKMVLSAIENGQERGDGIVTPRREDAEPPKPILLYGVTGSGKTEVYLQAIAAVLAKGEGAIVLVPEIALTPQTVQRFAGRFGAKVAVLHSALSDGERHDEWRRIHHGEARVVVGPRSAVFAPVEKLGLIVVDEEHEPSYKQEEAPRYHARDTAVMRAQIEGCAVLLGSATPALESWRNVAIGKYRLARLDKRADNAAMPAVRIVDMRIEQSKSGRTQVFSQELLDAIGDRLERGEQTMLFLNRRGYSTSLICPACGYVATCGACEVAYTYHRVDDCLRCHICGTWERPAQSCPACRDPKFRYAGFGTQRIENIIAACFPRARVARMDADSTSRKLSHDDILGAFRAGRTDILIGTQMIAKGLHFPNVTLVGIVLADSSLHLPDFRAGERTFQLLAQVSGRTGRGATPGEVLIQTYTPEHPAIIAARTEDYEAFAAGELPERRRLGYPPFTRLACLTLRGVDEDHVAFTAAAFAKELSQNKVKGVEVSESCPAPLAKIKHNYRYQVILRAPRAATLAGMLRSAMRGIRLPKDVAASADIDALALL